MRLWWSAFFMTNTGAFTQHQHLQPPHYEETCNAQINKVGRQKNLIQLIIILLQLNLYTASNDQPINGISAKYEVLYCKTVENILISCTLRRHRGYLSHYSKAVDGCIMQSPTEQLTATNTRHKWVIYNSTATKLE